MNQEGYATLLIEMKSHFSCLGKFVCIVENAINDGAFWEVLELENP